MLGYISGLFKKKANVVSGPAEKPVLPEQGHGPELPGADSVGLVKLGVIVGHSEANPGAALKGSPGMYEYHFNKMVAMKMVEYAKTKQGLSVELILRDGGTIAQAYDKARELLCDAVIELHFNAFNESLVGTETLCSPDKSDVDFAHTIHKGVCNVFSRNGSSRGVTTISKSARGGVNVHSFPGGVNCLVEPFFGDNMFEAKNALRLIDAYAKGLIDSTMLWARQVDLVRI